MGLSEAHLNNFPFQSINHPCNEALQWTLEQLRQAGLHPVQTSICMPLGQDSMIVPAQIMESMIVTAKWWSF